MYYNIWHCTGYLIQSKVNSALTEITKLVFVRRALSQRIVIFLDSIFGTWVQFSRRLAALLTYRISDISNKIFDNPFVNFNITIFKYFLLINTSYFYFNFPLKKKFDLPPEKMFEYVSEVGLRQLVVLILFVFASPFSTLISAAPSHYKNPTK